MIPLEEEHSELDFPTHKSLGFIRKLRIKPLEGSRCGGGRLCNLNAPINADGCGMTPICSLVAEIDHRELGEAGVSRAV
jgi:hypothetical protein